MKRKKPVAPSTVQKEPVPAVAAAAKGPALEIVWVCLFSVLLFLSMTVQTGRMTIVLVVLAFAVSIGRTPLRNLRQYLSVPTVGLFAFAVMQGLAAIYSHFGGYAVAEYQKFLAAFALAAILLVRFGRQHVRGLLWGFAAVCAVIALLCVDMGSWGNLFWGFNSVTETLGATFADVVENSAGIRVNGIYNDANVTGAILGPAILVGLHLAHTEETPWKKFLACLLTGISAVSFLIAMSRGAILCFVLAALVYLAAERKDRLSLFFLMLSTAVALVPTGGLAMLHMAEGDVLPDVLALLCGVLLFLLDWGVGSRLARRIQGHGVAVAAVCLALAAAACVGAFGALHVTEPYTFTGTEDEVLYRGLSLKAGNYTVSGDWDGGENTTVVIYSRTDNEALMNRMTSLYRGPLADAEFTVPEDSVRVFFQFRGEGGSTLRSVTLSDGSTVPLDYKFLPEMIAYRMQDSLFHSISYLQRVQYLKDGWKLFTGSPLIGYGLGSTEGLLTSVQPFYYESKYLHSHVLQVIQEMGLLGMAAFLAFLLGTAWLLLRRLRKGADPLAAALLGCWVMINAHSLMEINFSIRAFQCAAYGLLCLPILLYAGPGEEEAAAVQKKALKWGGLALAGCLWLYLAVFGGLYESHRMVVRDAGEFSATSVQDFLDGIEGFVSKDVFDHEDLQLTYVANAADLNSSRYSGTVLKYVKELRDSGTYPACSGLARYYYLPRGEFDELFACSREGIAQEASAKESWNLQLDFYRNEVLPAAGEDSMTLFLEGVGATADYLETYSQGRLEEIALTEENQAFLDAVSSVREAGMSSADAYFYFTQVLGYGQDAPED